MEKIVTQEWREREKRRFRERVYRNVPWSNKHWYTSCELADLHHSHLLMGSESNSEGMISFTPSEDKGVNDRQTDMKPRRYLQKYLKAVIKGYIYKGNLVNYWNSKYDYDDPDPRPDNHKEVDLNKEVEYWASRFEFLAKPTVYHNAMDRDAIRWVYEHCGNGATSCMTHHAEDFSRGGVHPTEAYAAGDLAISFIYEDEIPPEMTYNHPKVVARAVTWPDRKIYGRIYGKYGNETRLRQALEEDGYRPSTLVEARMLNIEVNGAAVFPYLDNDNGVDYLSSKYYVIRYEGEGEYRADSQEGWLNEEAYDFFCVSCDEGYRGDDYWTLGCGDRICDGCYNEYYFSCNGCDDVTYTDDGTWVDGQYLYCETCRDDEAFECVTCDEWTGNDSLAGENEDSEQVCNSCAENDDLQQNSCGVLVAPIQQLVTVLPCTCNGCEPIELSREEA